MNSLRGSTGSQCSKTRLQIGYYLPRRAVVKDRGKAIPTWAITSTWCDGHVIFFDVDGNGVGSVIQYLIARDIPFIVARTRKGYHVIGLKLVSWKELNSMWSRLKPHLDSKWVTLQRKRGFAVLRVCGKYPCQDIRVELLYLPGPLDPPLASFLFYYVSSIKACERLLGRCRGV
jgi:hypothetical protein